MIRILTSNFKHYHKEEGISVANEIDNTNGIVEQIKNNLKNNDTILFVASDPNNIEKTRLYSDLIFESMKLSGIIFNKYLVLDENNYDAILNNINDIDLIFLSGGSTYTQNNYFKNINLKEKILKYNGMIIGQSAGSLNMAKDVFNSPEEMKNSEPIYFEGLGLTNINIEPHFIYDDSDFNADEKYQRKIILKESEKRIIYGQVDGSHIFIDDDDNCVVYGNTYVIKNGQIQLICNDKEKIGL